MVAKLSFATSVAVIVQRCDTVCVSPVSNKQIDVVEDWYQKKLLENVLGTWEIGSKVCL